MTFFVDVSRHLYSVLARNKETFQCIERNLTDKSGLLSGFQRFFLKQYFGKLIYSVGYKVYP